MPSATLPPQEHVPLAPFCTLGVGGPARFFVEARDEAAVVGALAWARRRGVPLRVLGGGSNLVVADEGVDGLVVRVAIRGVEIREDGRAVSLTAAAGEAWDDIVRRAVERDWAGIECLSGIPGLVGATPIQNVGAYGQDVSETVTGVRALDTTTSRVVALTPADCGFTYRDSVFKSGEPDRYVVLAVTYRLRPGAPPAVRYAEVAAHLERAGGASPTLARVRETVVAIRRSKSMVIEGGDPNRRSCGSFFTNPVVSAPEAERVAALAADPGMPRWPQPGGAVKLAAAWLIERAGFRRGHREGAVGLSTRHALAIVAHDGARAVDVLAFARRVHAAVEDRFGVRLAREPVLWSDGA
ncbi:MAG: UDP-N-acetylmuramate dehydrogenase [Candidatus Rokuibacteriota bacterium]